MFKVVNVGITLSYLTPLPEDPNEYPHYYFWKLESSAYILPLTVWVYLHSNLKVIDFGTNQRP